MKIFKNTALFPTVFISCLLIASCYTERKATKQVANAQAVYPAVVSSACARFYPPQNSTETKTEYVKGDTVRETKTETIYDTLTKTYYTTTTVNNYIHDTAFITRNTVTVNTAAVDSMGRYVEAVKEDSSKLRARIESLKSYLRIAIWAAGVLLAYTIARLILKAYTRITLP
jgi:hypothetical protein